jgi:hypothetical protein
LAQVNYSGETSAIALIILERLAAKGVPHPMGIMNLSLARPKHWSLTVLRQIRFATVARLDPAAMLSYMQRIDDMHWRPSLHHRRD